MSSADVLHRLLRLNLAVPESRRVLANFLHFQGYAYFVSTLGASDVLNFVNFLDKTLDAIPASDELWRECLDALRQICGDQAILPSTYVLARGLVKDGKTSLTTADNLWEAQYKRKTVRIRVLRIPSIADQGSVKKKFCHEVVLWKRLNHQNVARVLGITTDPYQIVFDRVSDKDIVTFISTEDCVDRVVLLSDIGEGLAYLHSQKVVHGRLRGSNILIDQDGRALLTDFASPSITWTSQDASGQAARWCAPEVLGNDPLSGTPPTLASDIFSFGMVVLEVFSGKVPFDGVSDDEVVKRIRSGERPDRPIGSNEFGLSDGVWEVVKRCWHGSPELRPGIVDVLEYTRRIRPVLRTEYSEAATLVNPEIAPIMSRWRRFLSTTIYSS